MAKMNPYLTFDGTCDEAFKLYKSVFGGEFTGYFKMSDMPEGDKLPANEKNRVMHVSLPIDSHTQLMGSDSMPSMGHKLTVGNAVSVSLHPESRGEADRLFKGLSAGGKVENPMEDTFWGAYYGSFVDKFGIHWMINFDTQQQQQ